MQGLWSSASYEAHLLSLPFALAPAAMLVVISYAAVMRGAPVLRGWLLAHCLCLLPYGTVLALSPSITSEPVARTLFQVAASFIPMAAATGTAFQLALIRRHRKYRWVIRFVVASAAVWIIAGSTSDSLIDGVRWLDGFWYPNAGRYAWLALIHTLAITVVGFGSLGHVALTSKPSTERRQLRLALLANLVTYSGLVDVGLAYGIGVFPIGWLLSGIGSLLVVRALVVEDLLRVRAVDTRAPMLVAHFAAALLLGWVVIVQLGDAPWLVRVLVIGFVLLSVRASVVTISLVNRRGHGGEGPLERLLAQLMTRTRAMVSTTQIAQLAIDIVELGLGVRASVLLASEQDWGWTDERGVRLADPRAPDPLLMSWLAEQRAALFADDVESVPGDLRAHHAALFETHRAHVIVPIGSADELIGLVVVPATTRRLRGRELAFLERAAERLAEALLHARMAQRAAARAALAREVELAATVQAELLPGTGPHVHGAITVLGSWQPATRCAGDFWGVYPLDAGRVLIAIGDVTGHGVASAMVTAAAVAACDVCVRRTPAGSLPELGELIAGLDAAVRRVGGGELAMTCFVAILDPARSEIRFVSCGHPSPYLCRATDKAVELQVLVGRGNPLGTGVPTAPRVLQRPIQAGDLVVWYTDGVTEAQNPAGVPFGDGKLQRLLRRIDRAHLTPPAVHDLVQGSVAAHRAGGPLNDDETIVVAQISP